MGEKMCKNTCNFVQKMKIMVYKYVPNTPNFLLVIYVIPFDFSFYYCH